MRTKQPWFASPLPETLVVFGAGFLAVFGARPEGHIRPEPRLAGLFEDAPSERAFFVRHHREKTHYGSASRQALYKGTNFRKQPLEQRSGRRRLYDHNLFLRAAFQGQILTGDGSRLPLDRALFLDIGSAILFGDGAPTVRDIHEDPAIRSRLHAVVATDINDRSSPRTRYIEIYRKSGRSLPFPVEEIEMRLVERRQVQKLVGPYALNRTSPVILRSVNSGPDLYYTPDDVRRHLYAVRSACFERNTLYFFNIFVLWKPALAEHFVLLGQIDENLGANRRIDAWALVNWQKRRLADAFRPNPRAARFRL